MNFLNLIILHWKPALIALATIIIFCYISHLRHEIKSLTEENKNLMVSNAISEANLVTCKASIKYQNSQVELYQQKAREYEKIIQDNSVEVDKILAEKLETEIISTKNASDAIEWLRVQAAKPR